MKRSWSVANVTETASARPLSKDKDRAERIAREITSGFVAINGMAFRPGLPFGGG